MVPLFGHFYATYCPPERERRAEWAGEIGRRGLFQCIGVIATADRMGTVGEPAMMPRDLRAVHRFPFHKCPLSHLTGLVAAPLDETRWTYGTGDDQRPA